MRSPRPPLIALVALTGCGDALVGGSYRGEPLFKVEGQIASIGVLPEALREADFAISVFWSPFEAPMSRMPRFVEQSSVTTSVRFPSSFELRVFEPPGEAHFASADDAWVPGLLLVYADLDGDRSFRPEAGDVLVGGGLAQGLLYARLDVPAAESPTREALSAGFSVVDLPLGREACAAPPMRRGDDPRRMEPGSSFCGDGRGCGPGTVCDPEDRICVPDTQLQLQIVPEFRLQQPFCRF
jgi:xanthosine utilization system XapX-like protein